MSCNPSSSANFTFKWILENFYYFGQKLDHVLTSPAFIVDTMERTKWHLKICPRKSNKSVNRISLHRAVDSKGPASVTVAFELGFLSSDGSTLKVGYSNGSKFFKTSDWGFDNLVDRNSLFAQQSTHKPRETLTIQCRMWKIGNNNIKGHCIGRTHIGVERKTFHWKIENVSTFDISRESLMTLKSTSDDKKIMTLRFTDSGTNDFFICFDNLNPSFEFSTFKASLLSTQGDLLDCGTHEILSPDSEYDLGYQIPLSKSSLIDDKSLYLPNDVLTLYCEFTFSTGVVFEGIEETSDKCIGSSITENIKTAKIKCTDFPDLRMDLSSMLHNSILCDVKLSVEWQSFHAHWFVLIARSPVFRAMYESDMKEKIKSQIHITDLKPETVRLMLHYLYTDELEELDWEAASELFVAADKYLILTLKDKCSSFLKNNLDHENACKVLLLSDSFQDEELKSAAQNFILENDKMIFNSSEWKLLMEANLNLGLETMLLRYKE